LGLGYPVDQAFLWPDMRRQRSSAKDGREEQSDARGTRPDPAHGRPFPPFVSPVACRQPSVPWLYRRVVVAVAVVVVNVVVNVNPIDLQQESGALEGTICCRFGIRWRGPQLCRNPALVVGLSLSKERGVVVGVVVYVVEKELGGQSGDMK